jgi:hypothetical protein
VDDQGFMMDISAAVIELKKEWEKVGINKVDTEEDWCEFACWNSV